MWARIRRKALDGFRFRRQHSIGPYVADFTWLEAMLVVELDGDQHGIGREPERDAVRDAFIEAEGFHVLRVWNHDVYGNIDGVLEIILDAAANGVRKLALENREKL